MSLEKNDIKKKGQRVLEQKYLNRMLEEGKVNFKNEKEKRIRLKIGDILLLIWVILKFVSGFIFIIAGIVFLICIFIFNITLFSLGIDIVIGIILIVIGVLILLYYIILGGIIYVGFSY